MAFGNLAVEALNEALARYGRPEIINTDQGSSVHQPREETVSSKTREP